MAWLDWSEKNVVERFKDAKEEHELDDLSAALLVLAYSVERAGISAAIADSDGQVNVQLSGGIETVVEQPVKRAPLRKPKAKKKK